MRDNFLYFHMDGYDEPLGYIHKRFFHQMDWGECWTVDNAKNRLTLFPSSNDFASRTQLMYMILRKAHDSGRVDLLRGKPWEHEAYPVYSAQGEHVMDINVCGLDIFGVLQHTVHLTATVYREAKPRCMLMAPKWSTGEGERDFLYDSTVSGRVAPGELPIQALLRLCAENGLHFGGPSYFLRRLNTAGTNSFQMWINDDGVPLVFHREIQYLFEVEVPEDIIPIGHTDFSPAPVVEPHLITLMQLREAMANRSVKPSSSMAYMAWLIRHGMLTPMHEPDLPAISMHLNRRQDLFVA